MISEGHWIWNVHLETLLDPVHYGAISFLCETSQLNSLWHLSFSVLNSFRFSLWGKKRRAVPVWKRQWGMHCTEHTTKRSHVLVYYYEIIGGIWLPSLCSLTIKHCINSQIHIEVAYVILRNTAIHFTETKNVNLGAWARNEEKKRRKDIEGIEFHFSWNIVGVGLKQAQRQCARLW